MSWLAKGVLKKASKVADKVSTTVTSVLPPSVADRLPTSAARARAAADRYAKATTALVAKVVAINKATPGFYASVIAGVAEQSEVAFTSALQIVEAAALAGGDADKQSRSAY